MDARYQVSADPLTEVVTIRLGGFFTDADVAALRDLCRREYARLGDRLGRHVALIDVVEADIQSREGLAKLGDLLRDPQFHGRRLAFVVPKSLARSQTRRLAADRNAAFFDSAEAAEEWLFGTSTDRAA